MGFDFDAVQLSNRERFKLKTPYTHQRVAYGPRARMAVNLIEKWGMVAAKPGPEDSAGRATLVLQDPAELVERACTTTELLFAELDKRQWTEDMGAWQTEEREEEPEDGGPG